MTKNEIYIARIKFQNKIFNLDGQSFEDFFITVMQNADKSFRPVKPQGSSGDKKNDGFNKQKGQYYQVYAPEKMNKKERTALKKIDTSFDGLFNYWNSISTIKEFFFVINDRYKGIYPSIEKQLGDIAKKFKIEANPFLCKDLEDVFLSLSKRKIENILDLLSLDFINICDVDGESLEQVINFLMNTKIDHLKTSFSFPQEVNFKKKIKINGLSIQYNNLLKTSFYQNYIISDYFKFNSRYIKDKLKDIFTEYYNKAKKKYSSKLSNRSDLIFEYIWQKASPRNTAAIKSAVLVLMSHYFESCDIFEEVKPNLNKKTK